MLQVELKKILFHHKGLLLLLIALAAYAVFCVGSGYDSSYVIDRNEDTYLTYMERWQGEITEEKLEILRDADFIFRDEIAKAGQAPLIWQYFAVLTDNRSVGVMGDARTYDYTLALRAVTSVDGMTADWARIPYDVLEKISNRIVNEVKNINRVVYDITSKPPATIEWL